MSKYKRIDIDILEWNSKHPYDYRWRKKYNIPFGSKEHKGISVIDQYFDIREEELLEQLKKEEKEREERINDEEFDNLDLNKLYPTSDINKESDSDNLLE